MSGEKNPVTANKCLCQLKQPTTMIISWTYFWGKRRTAKLQIDTGKPKTVKSNQRSKLNKMISRAKLLAIALFVMLTAHVSAQTISKQFEIGFNLSQYHKDFGLGINLITPYFVKEKLAIKVGANMQWLENFNGTESTWTTYQNFQLGLRSRSTIVSDKIFIYGEGGVLTILPNSDFSTQNVDFGGYGLFGFEFRPTPRFAYYFELGGVGTGATADEIPGEPLYSNGFLTNVGFRIGL